MEKNQSLFAIVQIGVSIALNSAWGQRLFAVGQIYFGIRGFIFGCGSFALLINQQY